MIDFMCKMLLDHNLNIASLVIGYCDYHLVTNIGYCDYFPMSRFQMPCLPCLQQSSLLLSTRVGFSDIHLTLYVVSL